MIDGVLGFTNEEIEKYLVFSLKEDKRFCVRVEEGAEDRMIFFLENSRRDYTQLYETTPSEENRKLLENVEGEGSFERMLEMQGRHNRYNRLGQITTIYFLNTDDFASDDDWFYIEFYTEYIAKMYFLNNAFIFMDETAREDGRSVTETSGEIVYEGELHNKTHEEILTVIKDLAKILIGAVKLERQNFDIPQREGIYEKQYGYRIDLYYPQGLKPEMNERVLNNFHFYFHDIS